MPSSVRNLLALGCCLATMACSDASSLTKPTLGATTQAVTDGSLGTVERVGEESSHSSLPDDDTVDDDVVADGCTGTTLACRTHKLVGTAVNAQALRSVPLYAHVLAREFDYVTPENVMKWGPLQPERGTWDFRAADALVAIVAANGQSVKGHALVWHRQRPVWASTLQGQPLVDAVRAHVVATTRHFRGKVRAWDVVNEAVVDGGAHVLRPPLHSALGIQGMADAFKWARAEDPHAKLYYNDYGIEGLNSKSDAVYRLVQDLLAAGAPIDGIGFQSHFSTKNYPSLHALRANIRRFAALGLVVNISELDVRTMEVPGTPAQRRAAQAIAYQEVASACATLAACDALTQWGFTDAYSWVDDEFGADNPLPFDEQYAKKPAYGGLLAGLGGTRLSTSANLIRAGGCESLEGWTVFAGGSLSLVPGGRNGAACRVSGRTQAHYGPSLALTDEVHQGQTLRITAYAQLGSPGTVKMTLKKVEDGKDDEYLTLASGAADADGWTLLSGNVTVGWQTSPRELVLYFETLANAAGAYAHLFVDDVTVQVLSRLQSP